MSATNNGVGQITRPQLQQPRPTGPVRPDLPETAPIGLRVWYHDTRLAMARQPRGGRVSGAGQQPGTVHLTIDSDPLLDIREGGRSAVFTMRDVPILPAYPNAWPGTPFCVAIEHILAEFGPPRSTERAQGHELDGPRVSSEDLTDTNPADELHEPGTPGGDGDEVPRVAPSSRDNPPTPQTTKPANPDEDPELLTKEAMAGLKAFAIFGGFNDILEGFLGEGGRASAVEKPAGVMTITNKAGLVALIVTFDAGPLTYSASAVWNGTVPTPIVPTPISTDEPDQLKQLNRRCQRILVATAQAKTAAELKSKTRGAMGIKPPAKQPAGVRAVSPSRPAAGKPAAAAPKAPPPKPRKPKTRPALDPAADPAH